MAKYRSLITVLTILHRTVPKLFIYLSESNLCPKAAPPAKNACTVSAKFTVPDVIILNLWSTTAWFSFFPRENGREREYFKTLKSIINRSHYLRFFYCTLDFPLPGLELSKVWSDERRVQYFEQNKWRSERILSVNIDSILSYSSINVHVVDWR